MPLPQLAGWITQLVRADVLLRLQHKGPGLTVGAHREKLRDDGVALFNGCQMIMTQEGNVHKTTQARVDDLFPGGNTRRQFFLCVLRLHAQNFIQAGAVNDLINDRTALPTGIRDLRQ